jgi:hypothetical protein
MVINAFHNNRYGPGGSTQHLHASLLRATRGEATRRSLERSVPCVAYLGEARAFQKRFALSVLLGG